MNTRAVRAADGGAHAVRPARKPGGQLPLTGRVGRAVAPWARRGGAEPPWDPGLAATQLATSLSDRGRTELKEACGEAGEKREGFLRRRLTARPRAPGR